MPDPETIKRSNLGDLGVGSEINLERCLKLGDRLDGHLVLGHIDTRATCSHVQKLAGSRILSFEYDYRPGFLTVEKGSVCLNGISLTVIRSKKNSFSVAVIPYTLDHTNLKEIKTGDKVNIEFDSIGKYVSKILSLKS